MIGYTVAQKNALVLKFSSRYLSGGLFLVDFITCLLMCRCPIVVFIYFPDASLIAPT